MKLGAKDPIQHTQMALTFVFNEDFLSALKTLVKVLEEDSCFVPALVATGELMMRRGHWELARNCFKRALKEDPQQNISLKGLVKACV